MHIGGTLVTRWGIGLKGVLGMEIFPEKRYVFRLKKHFPWCDGVTATRSISTAEGQVWTATMTCLPTAFYAWWCLKVQGWCICLTIVGRREYLGSDTLVWISSSWSRLILKCWGCFIIRRISTFWKIGNNGWRRKVTLV